MDHRGITTKLQENIWDRVRQKILKEDIKSTIHKKKINWTSSVFKMFVSWKILFKEWKDKPHSGRNY